MLQVALTPHRLALRAHAPTQKLFALLTLLPTAALSRPQVQLVLVIDTSGSMRERVHGVQVEHEAIPGVASDRVTKGRGGRGPRKIDVAMEAALRVIDSSQLRPDDWLSIIQFADEARVVAEGFIGAATMQLRGGVARLDQYTGRTRMGEGLRRAVEAFGGQERMARKVMLVTDGRTTHEAECRRAADALLELQAPVVALGVGEAYNEDLLAEICSRTRGKPWDLRDMTLLPDIFEAELGAAARQVISAVELQIKLVQGVQLASLTRVYPSLAEINVRQDVLRLGAIEAGDYSIFLLELDVGQRGPTRTRLAQLSVQYQPTAAQPTATSGSYDLVVDMTTNEDQATVVNPQVMAYVQQRNVDKLIRMATTEAARNPAEAFRMLDQLGTLTERFGNTGLTVALSRAAAELQATGRLTAATTKTIKLGARTQTVRIGEGPATIGGTPDLDTIRQITGA